MKPLAIAHRAGNSLAGLHEAHALRVDVIECDVHHHPGLLEVGHDRPAGPLRLRWGRRVPAAAPRLGLRDLLDTDRHGTTFMLDFKGRRSATGAAVAELLRELDADRPVLACGRTGPRSRGWQPCGSCDRCCPPARRPSSPGSGSDCWTDRRSTVSLHRSLLDEELVTWLHERVEVVMTWPVHDLRELDDVLRLGVSGVISDEQDVLRAVVGGRSG